MNQTTKLYLLLAFTILIWGNSFVAVDVAIRDGASPVLIAMARWTLASFIFGLYVMWKRPKSMQRSDYRGFVALAFIGVGVYYVFQYYGVKLAGPSVSSILVTLLCPIVIFLISYTRFGERVSLLQKIGLAVSTAGAYLVITNGTFSFISNRDELIGGVFGVVCAIFWALYTVGGKQILRRYDPVSSTAYISFLGTVMLVPFAIADVEIVGNFSFPPSFWIAALYLGILCTVLGYVFWFRALTGLSASATGVTLYFEPLVTVIFAWLILGQTLGWIAGLGGISVLAGVVLVSRGQHVGAGNR